MASKQIETFGTASSSGLKRRTGKGPLKQKKAPIAAAAIMRLRQSSKTAKFGRTVDDAKMELAALAPYMPYVSDTDARQLALRMYYVELFHGISPSNAQINVSEMFLISPSTVRRWIASWKKCPTFEGK